MKGTRDFNLRDATAVMNRWLAVVLLSLPPSDGSIARRGARPTSAVALLQLRGGHVGRPAKDGILGRGGGAQNREALERYDRVARDPRS